MELRTVGRSGLQVSVLGLGCNNFGVRTDEDAARAVVHASLDAGVTFFDTSNSYGEGLSEGILGRAIGARRDDVVIATKFSSRVGDGPYQVGASRKHLLAACERSLRELGTDYIDLYYQHFPDPQTPIDETLDALDTLVRAGKVRYVASSNFSGWQVAHAHHVARERRLAPFVANQVHWSLLARAVEAEVVPACESFGIGVVPYFPLASGLLTGKYQRGKPPPAGTRLAIASSFSWQVTDQAFDGVDRLKEVAQAQRHSLLELAIGWLLAKPAVPSVLVGATRPDQVASNAAATEVRLSAEEIAEITEAAVPVALP